VSPSPSRRAVLAGACGTCAAALTACATYGAGGPVAAPPAQSAPAPSGGSGGAAAGANAVAATADIPVGGGTIFADRDLVITQPAEGEFKAFSATCTHQGCAVSEISAETILCACHGSAFSISDGAPVAGPAPTPLAEKKITVSDGSIALA
jgi:Rieske Fe-S protein